MAHNTVTLFIQCLIDTMYPEVGKAMVQVFDQLGIPLYFPEKQTCCGQPAFNSGYQNEARAAARYFINTFEKEDAIVCPSGSCVHMVRHHYPELFKNDPGMQRRAVKVGEKTFEFAEYLVDVLQCTDVGAKFTGSVTYHDSCHLHRGLGIETQPRILLNNVKGLEFIEMKDSDTCCGFGGLFSVKYPEISISMADDKIVNILASGADVLVGCDMSCLMNISGRLSRRGEKVKALHLAQILSSYEDKQ